MENTNNSILSKIMGTLFVAMGIFLGVYAFFTNAASWTLQGGISWDNSQFLNSTFWNANPSTGDIIKALYGSGWGTAYTKNWNGYTPSTCPIASMNVVYTGNLSLTTLAANTIYVLTGTNSIKNNTITTTNCSAIISNQATKTSFFTSWYQNTLISADNSNNVIFDNISINGSGWWTVPPHIRDNYGISSVNTNNLTLNNIDIHDNMEDLYIFNSQYISINNIKTYNAQDWIFVDSTQCAVSSTFGNITINNMMSYNNTRGISIAGDDQWYGQGSCDTRTNTSISNSQFFNNTDGIFLEWPILNTMIYNSEIYNNSSHGIGTAASQQGNEGVYGIHLVASNIYNNAVWADLSNTQIPMRYYWTVIITGNATNIIGSYATWSFTSYFNDTTANCSICTTGSLGTNLVSSFDYFTNPTQGNNLSLLPWAYTGTNMYRGLTLWLWTSPITYSFWGIGTLKQVSPVRYSSIGTNAIVGYGTGGSSMNADRDTWKFIWSDIHFLSWTISVNNGNYVTSWIALTLTTPASATYKIVWDVVSEVTWLFTASIQVNGILSGADGTKNIFVQLWSGTDWSTYYSTTTILDSLLPVFTGITQSGTLVASGWVYSTGISFTFSDFHLSGATLNGAPYTGNTLITGDGIYTFAVTDLAGNSTGTTFEIDRTAPIFTGITQSGTSVINGWMYTTGVTISFTDSHLSGAILNGVPYASSLITGDGIYTFIVSDTLGNTTGIIFILDKTAPSFTGTTLSSLSVISGGYYTTGIAITFNDLHLSGASLSWLNGNSYYSGNFQNGSLVTGEWIYKFIVNDTLGNTTGITFTLDMTNPIITGNSPTSGLNITGWNTINFTRLWSDTNLSWYTLYINSSGYTTTGTNLAITLINGNYTWYVIAADRAGNTGMSSPLSFMITTPFSGNATITGTNIIYNTNPYTKNYVSLYLQPNQPCTYSITGDITTPISWSALGALIVNPYLTGADGAKNIYVTLSNASGEIVSKIITVYLDTSTSAPILTLPSSGATITWAINLAWSAVWADTVGLSGYLYYISTTWTFASLVTSGFTTMTSVSIATGYFGNTGTFYWYIIAVDRLGNFWTSAIQSFIYTPLYDVIPDSFYFNSINNATPNTTYVSNLITVSWLSANTSVLASIDVWALYISGIMVGTTWYVQNGWPIQVELISSNNYNSRVTSTLTIGWVSSTFSVTTATSSNTTNWGIPTNLSSTERLQIISVFSALRDLYAGDKQTEFLNTFLVMLQSRINTATDSNQRDALQYLYDLSHQYLGGWSINNTNIWNTLRIINGIYTAPNGKKYTIMYDSTRNQFTSSNFLTPKYFPTLDVLKYTIDINNPVGSSYSSAKTIKARWWVVPMDGQRQTSPYTAPNHKVFYFFKTLDGQYSSYTFTSVRYFDSLEATKGFIHDSNQ